MSNKRPAEAEPTRDDRPKRDKVGELEQCMMHYFMEKYATEKSRRKLAYAHYQQAEDRAARLYNERNHFANECDILASAQEVILAEYNNLRNTLLEMAEVLPVELRPQFMDRITFDPVIDTAIELVTDEELTESDDE